MIVIFNGKGYGSDYNAFYDTVPKFARSHWGKPKIPQSCELIYTQRPVQH
jgi:hypothetical protein